MGAKAKAKKEEKVKQEAPEEVVIEQAVMGRPTEYDPSLVPKVREMCDRGATDAEIADLFGVSTRTIFRWKLQHKEFCLAVSGGKDIADERVERSLYQKATGFYYREQQAIKIKNHDGSEQVEVIEVEKFMSPDTQAQQFWLKNRRRNAWADLKQLEVGGPGDFSNMTDDEIKKRVLEDQEYLAQAGVLDHVDASDKKASVKGNGTQH